MSLNQISTAQKDLVEQLLREEHAQIMRERRSVHRNPFVRPVTIVIPDTGQCIVGFSKNISQVGIGVVTKIDIPLETVATVHISRVDKDDVVLQAECRWQRQFVRDWHISGWHFLQIVRP